MVKTDYTREELISLCEKAIVPVKKWGNRDTPGSHEQLGRLWAMLKAGCEFEISVYNENDQHYCHTNEECIYLEVKWPGFGDFETGNIENCTRKVMFYVPTEKRLNDNIGFDWY